MECSICYESKEKMGVTDPCGHLFCFECFERSRREVFMRQQCGVCKAPVNKLLRVFSNDPDSVAADKISCAVFEMEEAAAKLAAVKEDLSEGLQSVMEKRKQARREYEEIKAKSKEIAEKAKADALKEIEVELGVLKGRESKLREKVDNQMMVLGDLRSRIKCEDDFYHKKTEETEDLLHKLHQIKMEITPAQQTKLDQVAALEKKIENIKKNKRKIVEDFRREAITRAYGETSDARYEKRLIEEEIKAVCGGYRSFRKCKEVIIDIRKLRDFVKTGRLKGANKEMRELLDRVADF